MIKHQVNQHARTRNVEPHRQSPTRQSPVAQKVAAKGPPKSNDYEWHYDHGEDRVRGKSREIDRPGHSLPHKTRGAVM